MHRLQATGYRLQAITHSIQATIFEMKNVKMRLAAGAMEEQMRFGDITVHAELEALQK